MSFFDDKFSDRLPMRLVYKEEEEACRSPGQDLPGWGQSMMTFSPWTSGSTRFGGRQRIGTYGLASSCQYSNIPPWSSPIKKKKEVFLIIY